MAIPSMMPQVPSRMANLLYVPQNSSLPANCVKCGQPSTTLVKKTFYWHPAWVYILILPGLLIYAIAALAIRKGMKLHVPLCDVHSQARKTKIWTAVALLVGFLPFGIIVGSMTPDNAGWIWLAAGVMFLTGLVLAGIVSNILKPTYIDLFYATFKGASEDFLRQLPTRS
jgi:hypothetical protein